MKQTLTFTRQLKIASLSLLIFLLALVIRVQYFQNTEVDTPIRGDAISYFVYAKNLNLYNTFSKDNTGSIPEPDSYWAPGYPFYIFTVLEIAQHFDADFYKSIMYSQAILGSLIVLMCFLIGTHFLTLGYASAASILTAFSPHLISLGNNILTETLFGFFIIFSLFCFILWQKKQTTTIAIVTGLLFGLCYLVNPVFFFAPFFLISFKIILSKTKVEQLRKSIPIILCFFMVSGTWTLRNHLNVPDNNASSSERVLTNLIIGSHSDFFTSWRNDPLDAENPATLDEAKYKGDMSSFLSTLMKRFISEPSHYLRWYLLDKPILLWDWSILIGEGDIYVFPVFHSLYDTSKLALASYFVMKTSHFYLLLSAFLGIFFLKNIQNDLRKQIAGSLYVTILYISSVYIALQSEPRYSVPLRPEMYLCAMFLISTCHAQFKRYKASTLR